MNEVEDIEVVKLDRSFDGQARDFHACLSSASPSDNMTAEGLVFYATRRMMWQDMEMRTQRWR